MKCKFCNEELVEGKPFCPSCGAKNEPQEAVEEAVIPEETPVENVSEEAPVQEQATEQPEEVKEGTKLSSGKLALAIVAGVVALAILVALIIGGMGGKQPQDVEATEDPAATEATEEQAEATEGTIPPDGNPDDVTCKGSYTVTDEEVIAAADAVVATMEGHELTNAELQVYYWMEVGNFLNEYGDYAIYFGMDYTQPLDTQLCEDGSENPVTWQQYFLSCALDSWKSYQSMAIEAEAGNYEMDPELVADLESIPEQLQANAEYYGLADAEELIHKNVGPGAGVAEYTRYRELYYQGYAYFNALYEAIQPTDDEIEAYFAENEELYAESGITKESGDQMNVRHILVLVEGGTTADDGSTVYSDEEWETCRVEAQAILDEWLAGEATEDSFAALAKEKSEDGGSSSNGGLYEGLNADTNFVENFKNWYLDESRQVGDYGLVKTEYGYHVMYFSAKEPVWYASAKADLISEQASAILPAAIERHPAAIDFSAIKLGLVNLAGE